MNVSNKGADEAANADSYSTKWIQTAQLNVDTLRIAVAPHSLGTETHMQFADKAEASLLLLFTFSL